MKESRFTAVISALIDMVWAGFLWLLCSLPLLTVGASSTALYYVTVKCVRAERGNLTKSFFRCFRDNFRQGTALWLLMLLYVLAGVGDIYVLGRMGVGQDSALYHVSRFLLLPAPLLFPWLFAFLSRFENTVGGTLKFSAYLAMRHLGATLLLAAETAAFLLIVWLIPPLLPLLPGAFCLLMSLSIEPVFRRLTADSNEGDAWYNEDRG